MSQTRILPITTGHPTPDHVNPIAWHQSLGVARQACARVFRDGGQPSDALTAFGLPTVGTVDWSKAVERIAECLSAREMRSAA